MLNFKSRDGAPADPKEKFALKPALYEPPTSAGTASPAGAASSATPRVHAPAAAAPRQESAPAPTSAPAPAAPAAATAPAPVAETPAAVPGSTLHVGINIKLKGVEISDCDKLVIEGLVEATVHSKAMQIDKPGTLTGTALIDVAEVHGEFTGELTARTRLVIHGTGRVNGTIRYGSLVVEDGGQLSGDVKQIERAAAASATRPAQAAPLMPEQIARRA